MAAAAPLIVVAADALLDAMVTVGSALAGSLGLIALAEAIDKNFSKDKSSATKPCEKDAKPVDLDDPSSLKGKDPKEVRDAIPKDWPERPATNGLGKKYADPNRKGDQVRIMDGNPEDPNPVKQGPYARISKNGKKSDPIPLKGNPTLESGK